MDAEAASLYELYHENTKLNEITEHDMSERIGALYEDPARLAASRAALKVYPYAERVVLPPPAVHDEPLSAVLRRRRSVRSFVDSPVDLSALSYVLQHSYGVTGGLEAAGVVVQKLRAAPSAGALYPVEVYPVLLACREAPPGVYHYNVALHCLELVRAGPCRDAIAAAMPAQFSLDTASLLVVLSAAFGKTTHKYGERGYRFVLLDAGHVMQNLYLTAAAVGLGCYSVGGFRDDEMNDLLGIDGVAETTLYAAVMGQPAERGDDGARER